MTASIAWNEADLLAFEEELTDLLEDERKNATAISKKLINKSQTALDRLVDHHYDLHEMYETEHRQIDEIDEIRDKLKASQAVSDHLADVRKELEAIVADLRGQLKFSQDESQGRKEHIEKQDEVLSQMKADSGAAQGKFQEAYKAREAEKDEEIKKYKDELKELQDAANKMKTAVGMAEKGTAALKNALNMCQDTLKDAL